MTFQDLKLKQTLLDSITQMGFKEPSPIQKKAIPIILSNKDIIAQAQTGTGKTAAFGLPCLQRLKNKKTVELLVITPTRELASQVSDELYAFGRNDAVKTATISGGQSYTKQISKIQNGAQVVVATPGRLLDILKGNKAGVFQPSMVVLDEADEMLDMGFLEDIKKIFTYLPDERQTLMFSATLPKPIQLLGKKILKNPEIISLTNTSDGTINKDIEELYCVIDEKERDDAITRIMDSEDSEKSIIFCRTKREVDRLATVLIDRGYSAKMLHGDMEQNQREAVMRSFQRGAFSVLVATDVAARGLDVQGVSHVINFHIPFEPESYVHRIGRTARAGKKGKAITLVTPREWRDLKRIKNEAKSKMEHIFLPTTNDVHKKNEKRLMTVLEGQKVSEFGGLFFESLVDKMGTEQAVQKLVSYIFSQEKIEGPQNIGLKGDRLERFFFDIDNGSAFTKKSKKDNNRSRNRQRGFKGRTKKTRSVSNAFARGRG